MKLKEIFMLTRPGNLVFFFEIVIGAIYGNDFRLSAHFFMTLFMAFISFQLCYSGIYIINDLLDFERDRKDPIKSKRMIASGKISQKAAFFISVLLLLCGLVSSLFISRLLTLFEIFILSFNLNYSLIFKKIPYIDALANSVTHLARLVLGAGLFGKMILYEAMLVYFIFICGTSFLKRYKELENNEKGRYALRAYSKKIVTLILLFIGFFLGIGYFILPTLKYAGLAVFIIYQVLFQLYFSSRKFKAIFDKYAAS